MDWLKAQNTHKPIVNAIIQGLWHWYNNNPLGEWQAFAPEGGE